ncbi:MAG: KEOPS complex subunit Cgi121 [Candidatus Ranarchaeia archaeon]
MKLLQREIDHEWMFTGAVMVNKASPDPKEALKIFSESLISHASHGQLVDADSIASWTHVFFAIIQALNSYKTDNMIAKTIDVEILLHTSGERQIHRAIQFLGIKQNTHRIAIILLTPKKDPRIPEYLVSNIQKVFGGSSDPDLMTLTPEKAKNLKKIYGLSEHLFPAQVDWASKQIQETLVKAIIDKGALLELEKVT